jgi:Diadenosine tetraphosphate (Ap4A) hydrolase and other HIT family hydrolases
MANCIFCEIVKGRVPSFKVFENEKFVAFLDIKPRNPGHTLVIPKEHFRWVWDVPYLGEYFEIVGKIARALKKAMKTDFVVSFIMGEEVFHAHIHLVPRFKDDGHGSLIDLSLIREIQKEEMEEIANQIKKEVEKA